MSETRRSETRRSETMSAHHRTHLTALTHNASPLLTPPYSSSLPLTLPMAPHSSSSSSSSSHIQPGQNHCTLNRGPDGGGEQPGP